MAKKDDSQRFQINGALWLCFHALRSSEWSTVKYASHKCAYCGNSKKLGHAIDCMIGYALETIMRDVSGERNGGKDVVK